MQYLDAKQFSGKYYKKMGKYSIYLIDDFKFRNVSLEMDEFGGYASNLEQACVPKDEIWVSKFLSKDELEVLLADCLEENRLVAEGMERWHAYGKSLDLEKELRVKKYNAPEILIRSYTDIPADFKRNFYMKFHKLDLAVYIVDGLQVRNYFKTDYVCGGHGYVYSWIPKDEIWIEKQTGPDELLYTLIHEFVERTQMKLLDRTYSPAHNISSKVDYSFRPDKLTKEFLQNLSEKDALEIINNLK